MIEAVNFYHMGTSAAIFQHMLWMPIVTFVTVDCNQFTCCSLQIAEKETAALCLVMASVLPQFSCRKHRDVAVNVFSDFIGFSVVENAFLNYKESDWFE